MISTRVFRRGISSLAPRFSRMQEKPAVDPNRLASHKTSKTSMLFSVDHKAGGLADILMVFKSKGVNLTRIESRPSRSPAWDYDIIADIEGSTKETKTQELMAALREKCNTVTVLSSVETPWFPRKLSDLDSFSTRTMAYGQELHADHPGFKDPEYRKRRDSIAKAATKFRTGEELPRVDYSPQDIETWRVVYNNLTALYPTHACQEYQYILPLLKANCGYGPDRIPQLQDVSNFMRDCTGFTLRPVTGLLSSRDFLNGLAFRVFHSTQYIRHHSDPMYTPEPDICHELLGHVPLFADQSFADFSHEIGLASLGVSDADIDKLATCYWFTVEFGLCRQGGDLRAYGAGLLSSFGELQYCLSDKPKLLPFDPKVTCMQKYPITSFQPTYFVAESFEDCKLKMREFSASFDRPFTVQYNPYAHKIDVAEKKKSSSL